MVVFAIHWHESVMGVHVSPLPITLCHLPPHPIPLDCLSVPALSALFHALNLDWSSILYVVIYIFNAIFSNHPTLAFFHRVQNSVFTSVSFVILHIRSSLPSL